LNDSITPNQIFTQFSFYLNHVKQQEKIPDNILLFFRHFKVKPIRAMKPILLKKGIQLHVYERER